MFEKVKSLLAEQLCIDESIITRDAGMGELGADSLDIFELVVTFEDEYGISIPDEKMMEFKTVGDIVDYLEANEQ